MLDMKYYIAKIDRDVELEDEIVEAYKQYGELHDSMFTLAIRGEYKRIPSKEELPDDVLSVLCNLVMINQMKALDMLPKALAYIESHYEEWTSGNPMEIEL